MKHYTKAMKQLAMAKETPLFWGANCPKAGEEQTHWLLRCEHVLPEVQRRPIPDIAEKKRRLQLGQPNASQHVNESAVGSTLEKIRKAERHEADSGS